MADAKSKLEEGINIAANGDIKIELKQAVATKGNGVNIVGVSVEDITDRAVPAITAAEFDRIAAAVERRRHGQTAR
jgi:hypothetical protein